MRLWHAILQHYHARRALRHALLSRRHVEKGEAHRARAPKDRRRSGMISQSFKRFWPADRYERLKVLQKSARKHGLTFKARNGGDRRIFLSFLAFWKGPELIASFWNIEEAENWLEAQA